MTDSFWADGPKVYEKSLRERYELRLNDLRKHRNEASAIQRAEIDAKIKHIETEFKSKLDTIDDSLF